MAVINFSPEFDLDYYRKSYPELNNLPDEVVKEHYKRFAVEQGHSTCFYDRREYLQLFLQNIIDKERLKALEIGCGGSPFLRGKRIKYFETVPVDDLKEHYIKVGRSTDHFPKKFDFVSPTGDLGIIDETFDVVLSCHVIEHCPDFIEHLQNVNRLLKKGGLYILIVPDKRYCFDHYNSDSTLTEVIDAFVNERKTARLADVISTIYTRTHNSAVLHWLGEHGKRFGYRTTPLEPDAKAKVMGEYFFDDGQGVNPEQFLKLIEKYAESLEKGEYLSAHNWRFTPDSFRYIVDMLNKLGFINFPLHRLCHTIWRRLEFIAMLEKV